VKVFTIIKEHSERVMGKNFVLLGGKPLWAHLIDELSDFQVYVNTDCDDLIRKLERAPYVDFVTPIRRNRQHIEWEADAERLGSPVLSMLDDFLENFVLNDDEPVALTHVTSPFLRAKTLKRAFAMFNGSVDSVHSVKIIQDFLLEETVTDKFVPINFKFDRVSRTQDLPRIAQSLGAFFILSKKKFNALGKTRLGPNSVYYPLDGIEALEIDTPQDLELVKAVLGVETILEGT
jgi:CMP-N-acetylneuraminic acid synthetase